ncbi:hypothetical protein F4803DRAFT_248099 [Xylaria telfairii]|nr:hypothetical protein F4803DRAFT_248099 [Xylaria telfairii]
MQFDWLAQLFQFELSASNVFFLWLTSTFANDDGSDPPSFISHYFNISNSSDTFDIPSNTPSLTPTTLPAQLSTTFSPPTITTTTSSIPATTSSSGSSPSGLSTGAKAGIGVGASLAGLAIITLSLLLFRSTRQNGSYRAPDQPQASEILTPGDITVERDAPFQGFKRQTLPTEIEYYQQVNSNSGHPIELPVRGGA